MPITIEDIHKEASNKPYMAKAISISWPHNRLQSTIIDSPKIQSIIDSNPEFLENFICDYDEIKSTINTIYSSIPKLNIVKTDKPKLICVTCGRECTNKYCFDKHSIPCASKHAIKAKNALIVHSCDKCGKTFDNDYNKRAHAMGSKCKPAKPILILNTEVPIGNAEIPIGNAEINLDE